MHPKYWQIARNEVNERSAISGIAPCRGSDTRLLMEDKTDLVDTYFSVMANTPLKAIIFFLVLAFGAAIPGWLHGYGSVPTFVMWPLGVFGALFTWGSAMPLFGLAYLCLFGCLFNYLVSEQTLRPLFYGFSICFWCSLRVADDLIWLAVVLYVILLSVYLFAPAFKRIREYERRAI